MSEERTVVSFVVPLFNTGASLPVLLAAFRELHLEENWEVVLVDDGSLDSTAREVVAQWHDLPVRVTLVELARNYGEHAAVLEGFRHAEGEYVVNLDDDLQNPLGEAVRMLRHLQAGQAEVVYARYREKQHAWWRNLGSRAVNLLATVLLDKPPALYLSSFRAMRRALVQRLVCYRGPYPYIDGLILSATDRIGHLEVEHAPRVAGRSSYTVRRLVRLAMNLCFDFSIMPLRAASVLGLLLCLVGGLILGEALVETVVWGRQQAGWASLMGAITVFSGAQLLMLGLIGEYVGRAFLTVSGKPQSLVRNVTIHSPLSWNCTTHE